MRRSALFTCAVLIAGCHTSPAAPVTPREPGDSRYLFVWAGDSDKQQSDFLAVVDVDRHSRTYAQVVATLPVGDAGTVPHHTEYEMPAGGELWANGFAAGRTYRLDLRDPTRPRLAGAFTDAGPYGHPHSFARLPNGHVLGAFQHRTAEDSAAGGLVELDSTGRPVRSVSAAGPPGDRRSGPTASPWCPRSIASSPPPRTCTSRSGAARCRSGASPTSRCCTRSCCRRVRGATRTG